MRQIETHGGVSERQRKRDGKRWAHRQHSCTRSCHTRFAFGREQARNVVTDGMYECVIYGLDGWLCAWRLVLRPGSSMAFFGTCTLGVNTSLASILLFSCEHFNTSQRLSEVSPAHSGFYMYKHTLRYRSSMNMCAFRLRGECTMKKCQNKSNMADTSRTLHRICMRISII